MEAIAVLAGPPKSLYLKRRVRKRRRRGRKRRGKRREPRFTYTTKKTCSMRNIAQKSQKSFDMNFMLVQPKLDFNNFGRNGLT